MENTIVELVIKQISITLSEIYILEISAHIANITTDIPENLKKFLLGKEKDLRTNYKDHIYQTEDSQKIEKMALILNKILEPKTKIEYPEIYAVGFFGMSSSIDPILYYFEDDYKKINKRKKIIGDAIENGIHYSIKMLYNLLKVFEFNDIKSALFNNSIYFSETMMIKFLTINGSSESTDKDTSDESSQDFPEPQEPEDISMDDPLQRNN